MPQPLVLTAIDDDLGDAWEVHCGDLPGVEIYRGSIFDCGADVFVSPANSFGFMDGGIDLEYLRRWPWIQDRVQTWIRNAFHGELLVGQAFATRVSKDIDERDEETGDYVGPTLIVAPTMRVPMILPADTVNPYLAAKAIFRSFYDPESTESLAMPGLGTGVGRVPADVCARQVRQAFREAVLDEYRPPASWQECAWRQQCLVAGREY